MDCGGQSHPEDAYRLDQYISTERAPVHSIPHQDHLELNRVEERSTYYYRVDIALDPDTSSTM